MYGMLIGKLKNKKIQNLHQINMKALPAKLILREYKRF